MFINIIIFHFINVCFCFNKINNIIQLKNSISALSVAPTINIPISMLILSKE